MQDIEDCHKLRLAIIDADKCKPKKCKKECMKSCPVNSMGKFCIQTSEEVRADISESLCIGCGQCAKKCPFNAIKIVNLPQKLPKIVHRFAKNSFQLHSLPEINVNKTLSLIGRNGIGKSTILKILNGQIKPNLGIQDSSSNNLKNIHKMFRGTQLQNIFDQQNKGNHKTIEKHQNIFSNDFSGKVQDHLKQIQLEKLELSHLATQDIDKLSGGELQRFLITYVISQDNFDLYMLDEASSFLDIQQRLKLADYLSQECANKTTLIIEHDLALLDYVSDLVCIVYGQPGAYGSVSATYSPNKAINNYINGFLPTENMKFRNKKLALRSVTDEDEQKQSYTLFTLLPNIIKYENSFQLSIVTETILKTANILLVLGQNGTGKTSFILDIMKKINGSLSFSYKPQVFKDIPNILVIDYLNEKLGNIFYDEKIKKLAADINIKDIQNCFLNEISGGEYQKIRIFETLARSADVYILDEPSAFLDVEQRINLTTVIRRYIIQNKKSCIIIEHDILMGTGLADEVVYTYGEPGIQCFLSKIKPRIEGLNEFLKLVNVTIRNENGRFRINKKGSQKDQLQKNSNKYIIL